jgi:hypothetical protein
MRPRVQIPGLQKIIIIIIITVIVIIISRPFLHFLEAVRNVLNHLLDGKSPVLLPKMLHFNLSNNW